MNLKICEQFATNGSKYVSNLHYVAVQTFQPQVSTQAPAATQPPINIRKQAATPNRDFAVSAHPAPTLLKCCNDQQNCVQ